MQKIYVSAKSGAGLDLLRQVLAERAHAAKVARYTEQVPQTYDPLNS